MGYGLESGDVHKKDYIFVIIIIMSTSMCIYARKWCAADKSTEVGVFWLCKKTCAVCKTRALVIWRFEPSQPYMVI